MNKYGHTDYHAVAITASVKASLVDTLNRLAAERKNVRRIDVKFRGGNSAILALSTSRCADVDFLTVVSSSFLSFFESSMIDFGAIFGNTHPIPTRCRRECQGITTSKTLRLEH